MRSEDDAGADVVMIARASGAAAGPSDTNDSRTGGEYTARVPIAHSPARYFAPNVSRLQKF